MVKARNVPSDPEADPSLWNNTWVNWHDELDMLAYIDITTQAENEDRQLAALLLMAICLATALVIIIVFLVRIVMPNNKISDVIGDPVNVINVFRIGGNSPASEEKPNNKQSK